MLKDHQELLEQIQKAEALAVRLYKKGPAISETITVLRKAGNTIKERVKHYTREAEAAKPPSGGATAPASPTPAAK